LDHYVTAAGPKGYARCLGRERCACDNTGARAFVKFNHFGWHSTLSPSAVFRWGEYTAASIRSSAPFFRCGKSGSWKGCRG
jgi:hypothetical protein